ncbi:TetR/AcrR family transcriptional regulator [Pelatocladus sp. BLCC-F211]|uniref:TetR/AcrR family transcriptional regulator n=1 Tax=Pelatocladus sp. BLCC-F211 TaxID=3342752 RepID=UPI0035BA2565
MKNKSEQTNNNRIDRCFSTNKVDAILAGAMQEFLAQGYSGTTMDKVTAAAGVSKTTVYSYFQDKESLFTALIERLVQTNYRAVLSSQVPNFFQGEPRIVLQYLAKNIVERMNYEQQLINLFRLIIGESGRFPLLAQVFVDNVDKPALEILTQYFVNHPELQIPDPEATAHIFLGTLVYFTIVQNMLHVQKKLPMNYERLINSLVDLIIFNKTSNTIAIMNEL